MINLRLRTSKSDEVKLIELQSGLQMSSKAAVIRLAIGVALQQGVTDHDISQQIEISQNDSQLGGDYFRYTIFPTDEMIYKIMIQQQLKRSVEDVDFFPNHVKAYMSIGLDLLYRNFKLHKKEKLLQKIFNEGLD
jgi:hypothetical protein